MKQCIKNMTKYFVVFCFWVECIPAPMSESQVYRLFAEIRNIHFGFDKHYDKSLRTHPRLGVDSAHTNEVMALYWEITGQRADLDYPAVTVFAEMCNKVIQVSRNRLIKQTIYKEYARVLLGTSISNLDLSPGCVKQLEQWNSFALICHSFKSLRNVSRIILNSRRDYTRKGLIRTDVPSRQSSWFSLDYSFDQLNQILRYDADLLPVVTSAKATLVNNQYARYVLTADSDPFLSSEPAIQLLQEPGMCYSLVEQKVKQIIRNLDSHKTILAGVGAIRYSDTHSVIQVPNGFFVATRFMIDLINHEFCQEADLIGWLYEFKRQNPCDLLDIIAEIVRNRYLSIDSRQVFISTSLFNSDSTDLEASQAQTDNPDNLRFNMLGEGSRLPTITQVAFNDQLVSRTTETQSVSSRTPEGPLPPGLVIR